MPRRSAETSADEPVESDWRRPLIIGAILACVAAVYFIGIQHQPRIFLYSLVSTALAVLVGGWANRSASRELPRWAVPAIVVSLWIPLTMPILIGSILAKAGY